MFEIPDHDQTDMATCPTSPIPPIPKGPGPQVRKLSVRLSVSLDSDGRRDLSRAVMLIDYSGGLGRRRQNGRFPIFICHYGGSEPVCM